jgi:uncharacterized protein with HEPN domain
MSSGIAFVPSNRHRTADCLQDIIDNIARIERYIDGLDQEGLENDGLRRDAVERCLERICEAAFRLADQAPILLPGQPWADIRGMGNRLRHAYDQIDVRILWNVVKERLPSLKADATTAMERVGDARKV